MKLSKFRIQYFRSIIDTGWRNFSTDNVTVLIGQNESGKSSILEALAMSFSRKGISKDDLRTGDPLPTVSLRFAFSLEELNEIAEFLKSEKFKASQVEGFIDLIEPFRESITVVFTWEKENGSGKFSSGVNFFNDDDYELVNGYIAALSRDFDDNEETQSSGEEEVEEGSDLTATGMIEAIYETSPAMEFFDHVSGLLPGEIDVVQNDHGYYLFQGSGAQAANNYLTVAGLKLKELVESDGRTRANLLARANAKITRDFSAFWSQTIGKAQKLKLECEIHSYSHISGDKSGQFYLVFWIGDGLNKLYPKQRSQGVRWFVSFYLQLKASEQSSYQRFFLLDEPGANLHSKAQSDVIKLINDLSKEIPIVYSTHIPHMLEYDHLYRVLAVQRTGDDIDSPTEIKPAHELGTASTDTLSPVLAAMGVDLSNQEVIKKRNNVLLEEMSGFYYLTAFWELSGTKQEAHFIAATGVNKLPNFANMFLGWGLEYIVVVDDDKAGRQVYNQLKKEIFADDENLAKANMLKIKSCDGIEDVFSQDSFKNFILSDPKANIKTTNSNHAKTNGLSKPVLAHSFMNKVRSRDIKLGDLDEGTQKNIKQLVENISSLLAKGAS